MSNLLSRLEFDNTYNVIDGGTFKERFWRYFTDVKREDLVIEDAIRISTKEVTFFKEMIDDIKRNDKKVFIVSDYDADGVMALCIMLRLFDHLEIKANYYIPSRTNEGYGISEKIVDTAHRYGFDCIITLDNGIIAHSAIAYAKKLGLKTIVIDHHEYETSCDADIIIHPHLLDEYHQDMCTAGLVYALSQNFYDDKYSLILAMIATIGDVVPVTRCNRKIIVEGLKEYDRDELSASNIKVLAGLNAIAKAEDIAFKVVPKINAISRLDPLCNVNHFVKYFKDDHLDVMTAEKIIKINELRKDKTSAIIKAAQKAYNGEPFIIMHSEDYLLGLCGIVAGKLAEEYKRPAIILNKGDLYKGSGRSYGNFDLYGFLSAFKAEFTQFGGHQKAIGITLDQKALDHLYREVKDFNFVSSAIKTDVIKIKEEEMTLDNLAFIASFEPYGEMLKRPLFYIEAPDIKSSFLIKGQYPKYSLHNGHELFSFDKDMYGVAIKGVIGTLDISSYNKTKITMSLKQIVL